MIAVLAMLVSILGVQPAHADENSTTSLTLTQVTPATQQSGTPFQYRLAYSCSNLDNIVCGEDPVITVPLGDAADMAVSVAGSAAVASWDVVAGELRITLNDLPEGSAGTIDFTVTPPNRTTPNGTTWTLDADLTFGDGVTPGASAPGSVTSTATAAPSLVVLKDASQRFQVAGGEITYTIRWACPDSGDTRGVEDLDALTLVDTLPAGLTFVSSSPTATSVNGQTITIDVDADDLGTSCRTGATSTTVTIVATVDDDVTDGTVLTNTVTATGTPLSATPTVESTDDARITVVDQLGAGEPAKSGLGPVTHNVGDPVSWYEDRGGYLSATYPGSWLDTGAAAQRDGAELSSAEIVYGLTEAMYELRVAMPGPGLEQAIVDPMPCADSAPGPIYTSNAPGDLCQDVAFHPTMLTVAGSTSATTGGVDPDYVPQARLSDGTLVDLEPGPIVAPEVEAGLLDFRTYYVPEDAVERVAELVFPRSATMTNQSMTYTVGGYVDDARAAGDVLRNDFTLDTFLPGADEPIATSVSEYGSVYVLDGPQIGVQKWADSAGDASSYAIEASFVAADIAELDGPLTITDRLPAGLQISGPITTDGAYEWTSSDTVDIDWTSTQDVDPATGETVVTIEVPFPQFADVRTGGNWSMSFIIPVSPEFPGEYPNVAQVTMNDAGVNDTFCRRGAPVEGTSGAGFACEDDATLVIDPEPGSDAVQVFKTVRGSEDDDFKRNPAIGAVAADGGPVAYRLNWTNKSAADVGEVVLYDLLPRIGDTGTLAENAGQQRGSSFTPELVGIETLPAGVSVEYSTAANPCRDEVYPNAANTTCVDDWTASAPGDLSTVTALRFVSTETYAFDEGFVIELNMTAPEIATPQDIAWNTFAAAQTNLDTDEAIRPVESARVGLARPDFAEGEPEWSLRKEALVDDEVIPNGTEVNPGDTVTYRVVATNSGTADVEDVVLTDDLSLVLDDAEFVAGSAELSVAGGAAVAVADPASDTLTTEPFVLPVGAEAVLTYQVRVDDDAWERTLTNVVTGVGGTEEEPTPPLPCVEECTTTQVTPPQPLPEFAFDKSIAEGPVANGDGTWTVGYDLEVSNTGDAAGEYDLSDRLRFGDGVVVESAAIVNGPDSVDTEAGWTGVGDEGSAENVVVRDVSLDPGGTHTYRVEVVVALDRDVVTGQTLECPPTGTDADGGLFNTAVLTHDGGDLDGDACATLPLIDIAKSISGAVAPVEGGDGAYDVTYTLEVTNRGAGAGTYDLTDALDAGDGVTVVGVQDVTTDAPDAELNAGFDGVTDTVIVEDQVIAGADGAPVVHTYAVVVRFAADLAQVEIPADTECTDGNGKAAPGALSNRATVQWNGLDDADDACLQVGTPTLDKALTSAEPIGDGQWRVVYELTVGNLGPEATTYDLDDELLFAGDVAVASVEVAGPEGVALNGGFDGIDDTRVASDVALPGLASEGYAPHVYTVTVVADVPLRFDEADADGTDGPDCTEPSGSNLREQALNNAATLTDAGGGEIVDTACAPLPSIAIDKQLVGEPVVGDDGVWTVTYDVVATNDGAATGEYTLTDRLRFGAGITVTSAEVADAPDGVTVSEDWTGLGDTLHDAENIVATGVSLAAGATHTYRVVVTAAVDAGAADAGTYTCPADGADEPGGFRNEAGVAHNDLTASDDACAAPSENPEPTPTPTPTPSEPSPSPTPSENPQGELPVTGATVAWTVLGAALLLLLVGGLLVRRRRSEAETAV